MKDRMFTKRAGASVILTVLFLISPLFAIAQETAPAQQEKPAEKPGKSKRMSEERRAEMRAKMQQHHEQMEKMHQEMSQELQKQMTALREHAKAMEGISEEKQLLTEMKKHQQMTDALLGTMLEQREKMHAQMQKRHEQMRSRMGKKQPMEGSGTEQSGEHEQHHGK